MLKPATSRIIKPSLARTDTLYLYFIHKITMKSLGIITLVAMLCAVLTIQIAPLSACNIGMKSDLACARGFETREQASGTTFRWTDGYAEVRLSSSGYGTPLIFDIGMRSGRPAGTLPIPAHLGLNGHLLTDLHIPAEPRRFLLLVPVSLPSGDLARLQVSSATWQPDVRMLGLIITDVRTVSTGWRGPGLLLILSWLALLLTAFLAGGQRLRWPFVLALLLLPVLAIPGAIAYLPMLAMLAGGGMLAWKKWGVATRPGTVVPILIWTGMIALAYLALITSITPPWATLPLLLACGLLALGASFQVTRPQSASTHLQHLILAAALLRLVLLGGRLLSGKTALDSDIELFYAYGMALREVGLPEVEYPSGALLPWAILSRLSGDSREAFALLVPLVNIGCDLLIVAALYHLARQAIASEDRSPAFIFAPAAFYALSPLLEPFVFAKYDALPAALAIGGLALFATRRPGLAGLALGAGTTIKWTPLLSAPFLGLYLLQQRHWRNLGSLSGLFGIALALLSLPFALNNPTNFVLPYTLQGGRGVIGESIWLLVALPFDRSLIGRIGAPWGEFTSTVLSVPLMVSIQLGLLALLGLIALLRPPDLRRTLALAAMAPVLFLLLNRIFSPQYLLPISAGLLAALPLVEQRPFMLRIALALLMLAQIANFLIWPAFSQSWITASAVMFSALIGVCAWIVVVGALCPYPLNRNSYPSKIGTLR